MPLVVVATAWAGVHAPYHFFFLLALPRASLCFSQDTAGPAGWRLPLKVLAAGVQSPLLTARLSSVAGQASWRAAGGIKTWIFPEELSRPHPQCLLRLLAAEHSACDCWAGSPP